MTTSFAALSLVALYSAMAVYAIAFVAFAIDLARRSVPAATVPAEHIPVLVVAGGTSTHEAPGRTDSGPLNETTPTTRAHSRASRVAFALTVLAWLLHLGAAVLRAVAGGRVPWANMFEFSLTGSLLIVGVYLLVNLWVDLRFLGTFVIGLMLILLGVATVGFYVDVVPLPPALQSAWLVIHVFVALLATAFFALSFAASSLQLVQVRRESKPTPAVGRFARMLTTIPDAQSLDVIAYRITIVGFALWTFTLMAGSIWAERAWGRYWGWDVKEVWTFIIWVIYAAYIHAKATRGWQGNRAAWLAIIGFSAVLFNFGIVNVFFTGLHSYSGL
ncbi:MAG: c-type cytochrome biogenesis protein CcsB [Cryobacterium sp.]|nr:c-type cytochrome biogenesis protein CcsB [Micrococcales bacterium]MBX3308950.1 c-type cytochrome biogenesis protein CcsB [Cryobacterium sp.]